MYNLSKRENILAVTGLLFLTICITQLGYFVVRNNTTELLVFFSIGGAGFILLNQITISLKYIFGVGLLLRLILIVATPILSDDYFRFVWDGHLSNLNINPFRFKPNEIIDSLPTDNFQNLYVHLNSPNYFSIYPPLNQWCFYLIAQFENIQTSIITLRLIIIGFEIGLYWIIIKLLSRFKFNLNRIKHYWLNPLVIIELTGNLHSEGILIFFFLMGYYFLTKGQDLKAGLFLGLSFITKLFSAMFIPILVLKNGHYRWLKLALGFIPLVFISFLPFINAETAPNFFNSLNLYFQNFEFNGSVFQVVRWLGFQTVGYDIIKIAGPLLSVISTLCILWITWRNYYKNRKIILSALLLIITTYFIFTPILHPWYIILPLALSLFTRFNFPLVWSFSIFLSYSFYNTELNAISKSVLWTMEYTAVVVAAYLDFKKEACREIIRA